MPDSSDVVDMIGQMDRIENALRSLSSLAELQSRREDEHARREDERDREWRDWRVQHRQWLDAQQESKQHAVLRAVIAGAAIMISVSAVSVSATFSVSQWYDAIRVGPLERRIEAIERPTPDNATIPNRPNHAGE